MKKKWKPANLDQVSTYPIQERINKVSIRDFASPASSGEGFKLFLSNLPKILKAVDFSNLVAIGTDIIHQHPSANGGAIGEASFTDFRLLTSIVADLEDGGVVLNLG